MRTATGPFGVWVVGLAALWTLLVGDPHPPFPLSVGTVWDYEADRGATLRRTVARDTLVGGDPYVVVTDTVWGAGGEVEEALRAVVRFDEASGRVLEWDGTADRPAPAFVPCPLTLEAEVVCSGGEVRRLSLAERPLPIADGEPVQTRTYAAEEGFGVFVLAERIGPVLIVDADRTLTLRHARVDGRHFGTPPRPVPAVSDSGVRVWPNPVRGAPTLEYMAPGASPLVAEVFDALGRRVGRVPLPSGEGLHRVSLDEVDRLATGAYVVRVLGRGGVVGSAPFVKL